MGPTGGSAAHARCPPVPSSAPCRSAVRPHSAPPRCCGRWTAPAPPTCGSPLAGAWGGSSCDAAGATMAPNLQIRRTAPYLRHDFDKRRTPSPIPPPRASSPAAHTKRTVPRGFSRQGALLVRFGALERTDCVPCCGGGEKNVPFVRVVTGRARAGRPSRRGSDNPQPPTPRFRQSAASDATVPTLSGLILSRSWRRFTGTRPSANRIRVVVEKRLRVWRFRRCFCKPTSLFRCNPTSVCRKGPPAVG